MSSQLVGIDSTIRYRPGPIIRLMQGAGRELVHFPRQGVSRAMDSTVAGALASWTAFSSLDEQLAQAGRLMPSLSQREARAIFTDLAERGALLSEASFKQSLVSDGPCEEREIRYICVPTKDRNASLARLLRSLADNLGAFGRECHLLISDDSSTGYDQDVASAIGGCTNAFTNVTYAGHEERRRFSQVLAAKSGVPHDTIAFALLGGGFSTRTPGAARNAVLLQTAGSMILSLDDDTVCRTGRLTNNPTESDLSINGHATGETWCLSKRLDADSLVEPTAVDFLGEHQRILGRSLKELVLRFGDRADIDQMCIHLLSSVLDGTGRIRLSDNGAVGDCGHYSNLGIISSGSKDTRSRLQHLRENYDHLLASRQVVAQSKCTVVAHPDVGLLGLSFGLDNTSIAPPFPSNCNNEDGVFGAILGRCSEDDYICHLPFTIDHVPPDTRSYPPDADVTFRMCDLLLGALTTWQPAIGCDSFAGRLTSLGQYYGQLASLALVDFREFAHVLMCSRISTTINTLDELLMVDGFAPSSWARDVEARIEALRQVSEQPNRLLPSDLMCAPGEETLVRAQQYLRQYGDLLQCWPTIVDAALSLGHEGRKLGRSVNVTREPLLV
jgi:hypothetical protein